MADQTHLEILRQGLDAWNLWREQYPAIKPDLSEADLKWQPYGPYSRDVSRLSGRNFSRTILFKADLSGAILSKANLSEAGLSEADFSEADLSGAILSKANLSEADLSGLDLHGLDLSGKNLSGKNLSGADLSEADLSEANLSEADLSGANLSRAGLSWANLSRADLSEVDLSGADLRCSTLVQTNLERTTLEGCRIYGISAWSLNLEGTKQQNLNVSDYGEPAISVDNLEVAQFIYLLLNNERIRQVIDTIASKVVLILGRFTSERKAVLEALRESLRQHDYLPVLFDFAKPTSRDLTETISTLAHMARFIIADITDAKSIAQELQAIVPNLSVPVQPLLLASEYEYGMFESFKKYPWVLEVYRYDNPDEVLTSLESKIISPSEAKATELSK